LVPGLIRPVQVGVGISVGAGPWAGRSLLVVAAAGVVEQPVGLIVWPGGLGKDGWLCAGVVPAAGVVEQPVGL